MELALNNLQWLICYKPNQTKPKPLEVQKVYTCLDYIELGI